MEKVLLNMDTDTISDAVVLIENTSEFSKYKLLLYLSSQEKTFEIDLVSLNEFNVLQFQ